VPAIRSTATTIHAKVWQQSIHLLAVASEIFWIAIVKFGCFVKLGMAECRSIRSDNADTVKPSAFELPKEMGRVSAIHAVKQGAAFGRRFQCRNSRAQCRAIRKPAVRFNGKALRMPTLQQQCHCLSRESGMTQQA
jgi:hypothetical protein